MDSTLRVPKSNIVKGSKPALVEDNADLFWLSPDEVLLLKGSSSTTVSPRYVVSPSSSNSLQNGLQADLSKIFLNNALNIDENEKPDIVSLSDIESITYEQYYDSLTKLIKYKAIIKIRNSSLNKNKVKGVDARIYNPNA